MASEETELRELIRGFLTKLGVPFWHNLQAGLKRRYRCKAGLPDLEGVYRKRHFYVEAKAVRGVLSDDQKKFKAMVEKEGELVMVPYSWEDFLRQWHKFTH